MNFNLTEKPWIRVRDAQCHVTEISLPEALINAHRYKALAGESPAQDAAMLRLLISVAYTVFYRTNEDGKASELEDEDEYTLTIFYRFLDGSTAAPTITGVYWEGDPYDILSPEIEGYKATLLRVTGTMPARNVEYTVIYIPEDFILIDNFDTPLGLGQVNVNVGDCLE